MTSPDLPVMLPMFHVGPTISYWVRSPTGFPARHRLSHDHHNDGDLITQFGWVFHGYFGRGQVLLPAWVYGLYQEQSFWQLCMLWVFEANFVYGRNSLPDADQQVSRAGPYLFRPLRLLNGKGRCAFLRAGRLYELWYQYPLIQAIYIQPRFDRT